MKNEQLVLSHISHAKSMARSFASKIGFREQDESESIAMLALVESGGRYSGEEQNGAHFWAFVKPRVAGALVDSVRSRYGRAGQRIFVEVSDTMASYDPSGAIDARIMLQAAIPLMTKTQKKFLNGVLYLGVSTEADAEMLGMTIHHYRFVRRGVKRRIREAIKCV